MPCHNPSPQDLKRRRLLGACGALGTLALLPAAALSASDAEAFAALVRQGGCAVLIRHAQTEPGIGDPPGFRLDDCSSQRQLSDAGRAQARRLGQWFAAQGLAPRQVLSSQWCRCKDTAQAAFSTFSEWTALNSTFGESARQPAQTRLLRERLRQLPAGQFEVWVTHQVNMTDLTREYPAMGEAFVVEPSGRVRGRYAFT